MVPVASTPSISTRPPLGSSSPAIMLKMVLLPQPDGPIRLTKRPCGIESVTGASAWKAPVGVLNVMLTSATQSFGAEDDMRTPLDRVAARNPPVPATISQKSCQPPWQSGDETSAGQGSVPAPRDGKLSRLHKPSARGVDVSRARRTAKRVRGG